MDRVLLIAGNTFRAVISKRALYIWAAAVVLMFLRSAGAIFVRTQDEKFMAFLRANAISGSLEWWSLLCIAAAIFLGAGAVASEVTTKTIVTVLARPIRRWELLVGRWVGLSAFCVVTLAIGIGLALMLARYLGIDVGWSALAMAATLTAASMVLYGGVALALSGFVSAGLAGALTVLLAFMPPLVRFLVDDPGAVRHRIGVTLDYVVPPGYESRYAGVAWAPPVMPNFRGMPARPNTPPATPPVIDYPADRSRTGTMLAYAAVYFAVGCVLFSRRDVKLG
jgi:hypothetical protein